MKKTFFAVMICLATLCCSCTKEGTALFEGYYSYKTSGTVELESVRTDETTGETTTDHLTLRLKSESGQMNILTRDKDNGIMVITMNAVGGDVATFEAKAGGDRLEISETVKSFSGEGLIDSGPFDFTLTGTGEKLDDIVIVKFTASGTITRLGREYTVTDSDIQCVARLND